MKPFDISKFKKSITKSLPGISSGFHDPKTWVSTGSYVLNKLISNDFKKGIPLGKSTIFAGESGSGKSLICSGTVIKNAQDQGIFVILIDTENALDESWLHNFGVDTSETKLLKLNMAMVDDVAKTISEFMISYKEDNQHLPEDERQKILFVIDSLGMLMTPTDVAQFQAGEMKGDMGRKPKALKALVTNVTNMFGQFDVGLLCTNHTYASQDMYNPDPKVSGGCLVAGTKIKMADNSLKTIEEVMVGDFVQTYMGTNEVVADKTTHTYTKPCFNIVFDDGFSLACSEDHRFGWNTGRNIIWKSAKEIYKDNSSTFHKQDGTISSITSIIPIGQLPVYDISVKEAESYILQNGILSHNSGPTYAASIVVVLQKRKLKEDEAGNKISEVAGIRSAVMVDKSRYAKPFEKCELKIPYDKGMSPYTGMFEFLEGRQILAKIGNRYQYVDNDGVVHLHFRKNIPTSLYDTIMNEWEGRQIDEVPAIEDDEELT